MTVEIRQGDAKEVLATLPAQSVHSCICSPPYFALRSYNGGAAEIGTEATPAEYVAHLVEVFSQVKRVLHPTGTLWVVIGDSFGGERGNIGPAPDNKNRHAGADTPGQGKAGTMRKQLLMIPHRVALALQADGWYVRQELVWSKPAPMPESVTDRCTRSHEIIFMLAKQQRYYYDQEAIAEPCTGHAQGSKGVGAWNKLPLETRNGRDGSTLHSLPAARNRRSVWTIGPQPFSAAAFGIRDIDHYAVMPEALVEPMILAGTSEAGCCRACGAPWRRVVERAPAPRDEPEPKKVANEAFFLGNRAPHKRGNVGLPNGAQLATWQIQQARAPLAWTPGCRCDAGPPIPCTTLDPFLGSGTTALVAKRLGRSCIGIELNPAYAVMARRRVESVPYALFSGASMAGEGAAR